MAKKKSDPPEMVLKIADSSIGTPDTDAPESSAKKPSTSAVVKQRVEEILRIRIDGAQFHDVVQYGTEKAWGVSERQIGKYIAAADQLLVERLEKKRKPTIARHIAQREALYARCINAADFRTALAVLADLAKLKGIYATGNDVKELVKLATAQGMKIEEMERRLHAAGLNSATTPAAGTASGETGTVDAGEARGTAGDVEGGPSPTDG